MLNYARKNKYPRNRSAFTYLDEEQPSRLDFGKDKFGGPFTEEEVEDVKTVFRLLPLFLCVPGAFLSLNFDQNDTFHLHAIPTTEQTHDCIAAMKELVFHLTPVLLIPFYRFILYPVFYNYIPSMLKRVGTGLFLCLIGTLMNLTLDTVGHLHSNTTHCMFDTNTGSHESLFIPLYWLLIMDIINGVGGTLVVCTSIEFIMAQTPNRMRGVMMGLGMTTAGISILAHELIKQLFWHFNISTPSCEFYYYLVLSCSYFYVVSTILAKYYRLRERERHVNIQAIVEEHYERYLDQEEKYMREAASRYQQH